MKMMNTAPSPLPITRSLRPLGQAEKPVGMRMADLALFEPAFEHAAREEAASLIT
jgi:hypothetical protein